MGKTIRKNSSTPATSVVRNWRTQNRRKTNVEATCENFSRSNSYKKQKFAYNYSPHGRACLQKPVPETYNNSAHILKTRRQERRSANVWDTEIFSLASHEESQPEWCNNNQEEREYQKYLRRWEEARQAAASDAAGSDAAGSASDAAGSASTTDEAPTLLLKLGEVISRPRRTYSHRLPRWCVTTYITMIFTECLVREIDGEYLVVTLDWLLDFPEDVENDAAWQENAIGYLTDVRLPSDPFYHDIKGNFVDNET